MATGTDLVKEIIKAYKNAPHVKIYRTNVDHRRYNTIGLPTGFLDTMVFIKGRRMGMPCRECKRASSGIVALVEVKSTKEKLNKHQVEFLEMLSLFDIPGYVVRTRAEFDEIINNHYEETL
jgi:hypothetical protein